MSTIQMDRKLFTTAVFIDASPQDQRRILDINIEDTEEMFKHMRGMVATVFHKSLDGGRVTELSFWESEERLQAAFKLEEFSEHISKIREIDDGDEYSPYELRYVDTVEKKEPANDAISISDDDGLLTVVTKFEVRPESRDTLLEVLTKDHEANSGRMPGFVSVGYLVSSDATKVLEYLQFESKEAFEAHNHNPGNLAHKRKTSGLASSSETNLYEVEHISRGTNRDGHE